MEEESIYRLLFENSVQGMALQQGKKIVLVNQSFADMVGYTIDELLAFSSEQASSLIHPQDRARVLAGIRKLLIGEQAPKNQIFRFVRRNGEMGWLLADSMIIEYKGQHAVLGICEDITKRKAAEEAVLRSRKLLAATLDVLPVGVCLTDETGHYRMMNDAYCGIYEYDRQEMLGKHYSVIMPPDQIALANEHYARLLTGDVGIPVERKRQRKDGSILYIEAANALVEGAEGQKMVITTVRDITERRRGEEIIQMRLRLMEYATTHDYRELMQYALDEIGALTGSPIGFYHFVDDDQNSLTLEAWSTRTLNEFCEVEGKGMHYPIEEAGVWTDCVKQRKPVIHNDYASLAHRKGMPEGHAEVVRELVAPTIRDDRVVAILGVGNKPKDYTEQDVELVGYIADVVWSIIEQKRTDEQVRLLNAKLEKLALVDELTSLPNRRAFYSQGIKEINRAKRYATPLSLLMMDVDNFKNINDTYGHAVGDFALQSFARILTDNVREVDMVARLGGDEFSVLMPDTASKEATIMAERIRSAVEQGCCQLQDQVIKVTVSIGTATYSKNAADLEAILKKADGFLYQAKNLGRNQVAYGA